MKFRLVLTILMLWCGVGVYGTRPLYIVHMTDPQLGFYSMASDYGRERTQVTEIIGAINRWMPDCVVITGDLVNNMDDEAQLAGFDSLRRLIDHRIPVLLLPGNHDIGNAAQPERIERFVARYGADRFVWRKRGCCMIGVNTTELKAGTAEREQQQCAWIERQLQRGEHARCLILAGHHPLFVERADEPLNYDNFKEPQRFKYLHLVKRYGVDCVLSGHIHHCAEATYEGTQFWSTAAAGRTFGRELSGVRVLQIERDGSFKSAYYEIGHLPEHIFE